MAELLLIHSDTTNGSTTFSDSSGNNVTLTPVGNVQHSTAQAKFGATSIYFDGDGDYISASDITSWDVTGDYTVDFWLYITANAGPEYTDMIISSMNMADTNGWVVGQYNGGILFKVNSTSSDSVGTVSTNTWYHVALVFNSTGNTVKGYIDGVEVWSTTYVTTNTSSGIRIGGALDSNANRWLNGYISELRITNTAEWTHNFVPPTRPYGAPLTDYYTTIIEDKPVNYWRLGEASGGIAYDELGEHDLTWAGTPVYGEPGALSGDADTAMTLDGATEYASKAVANYRSGDSSGAIEAWIKTSDASVYPTIFASGDTGGASNGISVFLDITGVVKYFVYNSSYLLGLIGSTDLTDNIFHHVVVTSDGSSVNIYVDGVAESLTVTNGANTGQWFHDAPSVRDNISIGATVRSSVGQYFSGVVDEVAVYNYPLSPAQVKAHYQAGLGKFYAAAVLKHEPVNYWRLGETSGNALDEMGEHDLTWN